MDELTAINIIKRSMRYNRYRINYLMKQRHTASLDVLYAYNSIYIYTNDKNNCLATMCNDQTIFFLATNDYDRLIGPIAHYIKPLTIIWDNEGETSKKIIRLIYKSFNIHEFCDFTGWFNYRAGDPWLRYILFQNISLSKRRNYDITWESFQVEFKSKYTYDYVRIKRDHKSINEELAMEMFHPCRIQKWIDAGNELTEYMN